MHHWQILELALGKDVVKYIIQPYLLPPEIDRVQQARDLSFNHLQQMYRIQFNHKPVVRGKLQVMWTPSIIKRQNTEQRERKEEQDARAEIQQYIEEQQFDYLGGDSELHESLTEKKVNEVYSRRAQEKQQLKDDARILTEVRMLKGLFNN